MANDGTDRVPPLNLTSEEFTVLREEARNLLDAPWVQDDVERKETILNVYAKMISEEKLRNDRSLNTGTDHLTEDSEDE
jgi:hypothetical protein